MTATRPTSRWKRSEVTFGPIGRIIATAVVLVPIFYSVFFLVAAVLWAFLILPMATRDIWRRVRTDDVPPALVIPPEPGPLAPGESINDRVVPRRW
jgi:hypothetical protein